MSPTGIQFAATVVGLFGTLLMFFNSHSLIPYESAMFGSDEIIEHDRLVEQKNKKMLIKQRIGVGLLTFSFMLQLVSYAL
ncbi:hypothetical protein IB231_04615 [Pantoea sp. PNT02]|uniref:hypothetical protein n=1 Tax=Pantoea sp. PNT02 TaxID=2769261 RepID=UPI00177BEC6C|nr:hypothetical protein [Pantoea sp. PNT02]MBD9642910.1 hypothetical protein [Pantoea sp. PNT02]